MRIKRLLLTAPALLGAAAIFSASAFAQQLTVPYLAKEKLSVATAAAKDSIGDDAVLVGIATAGEIDLGAFGVFEGFNMEDGKSSAWGYQYLTPSGDDGVAVGVVQFIIADYIEGERGNDFGLDARDLDLTGAYSNSDAFAEQLKQNNTFTQYLSDNPDAVPEGIVLTWQPDGQDFLPEEFPLDKPIWAIYFNTGDITPDATTMACYMASGTGETYCVRAEASSVEETGDASEAVRLTVAPNPAGTSAAAVVRIARSGGESVSEAALYDMTGRRVADLTKALVPDGPEGLKAEINLNGLTAGTYVCRVVQGKTIRSVRLIVE